MFSIEWVNHASYIIRYKDFELLTDPWLFGPVFNNGWNLVSKTVHSLDSLRKIKNIWISHEHPDHFNPIYFKKYTEEEKAGLTIYFQKTCDKRVVKFLRGQGFVVKEMCSGQTITLSDDISIMCEKNGVEDSWLACQFGGHTILNLNDCIFTGSSQLKLIRKRYPKIHLLLTQFGYAEKIGNRNDFQLRHEVSKKWRNYLVRQTKLLNPDFIVPFASYKYFCHKENFYMNEGASTALQVYDDLHEEALNDKCIILYPGEGWEYGKKHDSYQSALLYNDDWNKIEVQYDNLDSTTEEQLKDLSQEFTRKIRKNSNPHLFFMLKNSPLKFSLKSVTIKVPDLNKTFILDAKKGLITINTQNSIDITTDLEISSENLKLMFSQPFGCNTLYVNGRFQNITLHGLLTLYCWAHLGLMLGADVSFDLQYIFRNAARVFKIYIHRIPS